MKEQLISLETAKIIKEKEFFEAVDVSYIEYLKTRKSDNPSFRMKKGEIEIEKGHFINNHPIVDYSNINYIMYAAPTQSFLQKWIREKHNIHIQIYVEHDDNIIWWDYNLFKIKKGYNFESINNIIIDNICNSYEEALEMGLQESLKLI